MPDPTDPHARVPSTFVAALFEAAETSLNDSVIGLHAGARTVARGPLFFLLLSTPRVSEGLRLISRFASVALSTLKLIVSTHGKGLELAIDVGDPVFNRSHHSVDYLVGATLSILRRAIPRFRLLSVDLIHQEIGPAGESERVLGCPVFFRCPHNVLRFPAETLDVAPAAASPLIAQQIERFSESLLMDVESEIVGDRVAAAVRFFLSSGHVADESSVASRMHVSVRTLQRQLEQESLKFKEIRDAVRLELAEALLSNRALQVKTVAESLGFADTAAFSKAFTRWAGVTPTAYRSQKP